MAKLNTSSNQSSPEDSSWESCFFFFYVWQPIPLFLHLEGWVTNHVCATWSRSWSTRVFLWDFGSKTLQLGNDMEVGASVALELEQALFYQVNLGREKAGAQRENWSRCTKRKHMARESKRIGEAALASPIAFKFPNFWFYPLCSQDMLGTEKLIRH